MLTDIPVTFVSPNGISYMAYRDGDNVRYQSQGATYTLFLAEGEELSMEHAFLEIKPSVIKVGIVMEYDISNKPIFQRWQNDLYARIGTNWTIEPE